MGGWWMCMNILTAFTCRHRCYCAPPLLRRLHFLFPLCDCPEVSLLGLFLQLLLWYWLHKIFVSAIDASNLPHCKASSHSPCRSFASLLLIISGLLTVFNPQNPKNCHFYFFFPFFINPSSFLRSKSKLGERMFLVGIWLWGFDKVPPRYSSS